MKTCVPIWGLVLAAPIYGKAHPQNWHQRLHGPSSYGPAASSSNSSPAAGATASPTSMQSITSPLSTATPFSPNSTTSSNPTSDLGLSPNCYRPNGIPMGWLPDGVDIMTIQNQVDPSHPPCTYGNYAQITSATSMSAPDSQMDPPALPSSLHGAIYTIALQPFIPFSQVSAPAIAASMNKILAQGPQTIWLRLAHEMNWYIDTNPLNTDPTVQYHGTTAEFKTMWRAVAAAVPRARVKMFWTPVGPFKAGDSVDTLDADWFPGSEYVDIVGLDAYGQVINGESTTFAAQMGAFCGKYPDIPVAIGETGWLGGGTAAQKAYWLGQVSSKGTLEVCPRYIGFSWFEYDKDGDYRIVMGADGNIAKSVLANAS